MLLHSQTDGQWPPLHKEIYANTVGVGAYDDPFQNKKLLLNRRGTPSASFLGTSLAKGGLVSSVTIRLYANNILTPNTVGEHSICSRNTKRADMESAPTANNVILIRTVGEGSPLPS